MKKHGSRTITELPELPPSRRSPSSHAEISNGELDIKLLLTALTALKRGRFLGSPAA